MPEYKPESYDVPNGIWESVFVTRSGGRPYKDGHYEQQCKVCHGEWPDHKPDCEYHTLYLENARLRMKLEKAEIRVAELEVYIDEHNPLGSYRLDSDNIIDDLGGVSHES